MYKNAAADPSITNVRTPMPDDRGTLEESATHSGRYVLRLYVAGSTPRSSRALTNVKAICENHLKGRYSLTVVDLYEQRERASEDQIMVVPTLVRDSPKPVRRVIGDLADMQRVLTTLDLG